MDSVQSDWPSVPTIFEPITYRLEALLPVPSQSLTNFDARSPHITSDDEPSVENLLLSSSAREQSSSPDLSSDSKRVDIESRADGATEDIHTLSMYAAVFCASVIGNVVVGLTIVANRRLHTLTNALIFNLCMSDLFIGTRLCERDN